LISTKMQNCGEISGKVVDVVKKFLLAVSDSIHEVYGLCMFLSQTRLETPASDIHIKSTVRFHISSACIETTGSKKTVVGVICNSF